MVTYVSIYTWNFKTGFLDRFVVSTGLEAVGGILAPGKWVHAEWTRFREQYVHLVGVQEENETLRRELEALRMVVDNLREKEHQAERLQRLLDFEPPVGWSKSGARVVGHRVGANAVLRSILIDKGTCSNIGVDTPVISPQGVVGRIHRPGWHFSNVLLLTDPNSHIPVIGRSSRIPAVAVGQGDDAPLRVKYVSLNAAMDEGEFLVTSGLGGMFPKGLPVARVSRVSRSAISLFQDIHAEPLVSPALLEEVLVLDPEGGEPHNDNATSSNGAFQGTGGDGRI